MVPGLSQANHANLTEFVHFHVFFLQEAGKLRKYKQRATSLLMNVATFRNDFLKIIITA